MRHGACSAIRSRLGSTPDCSQPTTKEALNHREVSIEGVACFDQEGDQWCGETFVDKRDIFTATGHGVPKELGERRRRRRAPA